MRGAILVTCPLFFYGIEPETILNIEWKQSEIKHYEQSRKTVALMLYHSNRLFSMMIIITGSSSDYPFI